MDCEEARLKIQALTDNELDEKDIPAVLQHMESCYRCRNEYIEFLVLQKKMKGSGYPEPPEEWFQDRYRRPGRKTGSFIGQVFFITSYVALIVFALVSLFRDPGVSLLLRVITGSLCAGILVLFTVTLGDRLREKKTDRYGDIVK